jgi:hypothetical protein
MEKESNRERSLSKNVLGGQGPAWAVAPRSKYTAFIMWAMSKPHAKKSDDNRSSLMVLIIEAVSTSETSTDLYKIALRNIPSLYPPL